MGEETKKEASPECVGAEGRVGVDVVMQPPLHRHVPVAHAVADLHAEVGVVAVDVLDGSEVVPVLSSRVRAGNEERKPHER